MHNEIKIIDQKIITSDDGKIMHFIKKSDEEYCGFGEAYFSTIKKNTIKAWKMHREMTCNIIVPYGEITFVFKYEIKDSDKSNDFKIVKLSSQNYQRLTIPPNVWFGFKGINYEESILINLANLEHDPNEVERKSINEINFNWSVIT